jgi:hypothetical protein
MELAPVYDLSAVNQRHFRHFQVLVQRDNGSDVTASGGARVYSKSRSSQRRPRSDGLMALVEPLKGPVLGAKPGLKERRK